MKLQLQNITLLGVDHHFDRLRKAFEVCEHYCDFVSKKIITSTPIEYATETGIQVIPRTVNSIEEYSSFMIKELTHYVETDYVLIVQYDGFILRPEAWMNDFLRYDYIGAPWWYEDGKNVGNGGFSLRSKKLLDMLAIDPCIVDTHPEDHQICRVYWDYLISRWIKFAPEEVAKRFSIEWWLSLPPSGKYGDIWTSEFGFHGHGLVDTDISQWKDRKIFFHDTTFPS